MAQAGKGKKVESLPEKKDVSNKASVTIRREAEESNSMMSRMEGMVGQEVRQYMLQKKVTLGSQVKATIKKLLRKDKPKKKKNRTMMREILGAVLKFHKDDHVDPTVVRAAGGAA